MSSITRLVRGFVRTAAAVLLVGALAGCSGESPTSVDLEPQLNDSNNPPPNCVIINGQIYCR